MADQVNLSEVAKDYYRQAVAYRKAGQLQLAIGAWRIYKSVLEYA